MAANHTAPKPLSQIWTENRSLVIGSILLFGSWVTENFLQAKWDGEKEYLVYWQNSTDLQQSNLDRWQLALLEYSHRYQERNNTINTEGLRNDGNYASLCANWLVNFYGLKILQERVWHTDEDSLEHLSDSIPIIRNIYDSRNYPWLIGAYVYYATNAWNVNENSGKRLYNTRKEIENWQKYSRWAFLLLYLIGSCFLAVDFVRKKKMPKLNSD